MRARLLLDRKRFYDDGAISEIRLWLVPQPVCGSGDHRHRDGVETAYVFETVEKLIADFEADVAVLRTEELADE